MDNRTREGNMRVLNLVTSRSPFFIQQVTSIERHGIRMDTVSVPGTGRERRLRHYLRFYKDVLAGNPLRYDLVHSNYGLTAPFALGQPTRPVVLTLWGSDLMGTYGSLSKKCASRCDEVIVRSQEMNEELGGSAHVIPAGIDFDLFEPRSQREARREVDWSPDEKHVLFLYSPDKAIKNYPLARDVVASVNERIDVPVNVQVVNGIPHDRIPAYMNAADALLLTSNREGSPNTIKEAMACNTPIVSTDVGDVRERLEGATQSAVCRTESELVDSLCDVLSTEERSNGRELVQELRLERTAERIIDVYERALE